MATLSGKKIADTFDSILHLTDEDGPLTGTVQVVEDGLGNDSALYLATDQVKILPTSGDTVDAFKVVEANGQAHLSIHTTGGTKGVVINEDNEADVDFRVEGGTEDYLIFADAGANTVGIGTSSPGSLLTVYAADTEMVDTAVAYFENAEGTPGNCDGVAIRAGRNASDYALKISDAGGTARVTVDGVGSVGIGFTAPTQKLHILGDAGAQGPAIGLCRNDTDAEILDNEILGQYLFQGRDASESSGVKAGASIVARAAAQWGVDPYDAAADLEFWTQSAASGNGMAAARMVINKDGKVGIGTQPDTVFHVVGSQDGPVCLIENDDADDYSDVMDVRIGMGEPAGSVSTTYAGADGHFIVFTDSGTVVHGGIAGNDAGGVAYTTVSDRRLKDDIVDIPDALSLISKVKPRNFTWKSSKKSAFGFIADEFEDAFPLNYIRGKRDKDGKLIKDGVKSSGEMFLQTIDTAPVIPVLVKAVQELSAKVTALENA